LLLSLLSGLGFVRRTLGAAYPIADLRVFRDRNFAIGCVLSFILGIGLFGSVYLMPVFLAFVRLHDALEIGTIMLATGLAQLALAPVAVGAEQRIDARLLTAAGFAVFAAGMGMSAFQTPQTDHAGMFWPQIARGAAVMFCLLPPTRLALGNLAPDRVPDASGLFNLMRNLGGAIGIALIDSVIYGRVPVHGAAIVDRLRTGDTAMAVFIGLSREAYAARPPGPPDEATQALLRPLVERAALTLAIDEAWAAIAVVTALAALCAVFSKKPDGSRSLRREPGSARDEG
jgi:DHA2 family multidrug resistance protein